ncbi:MAG TPA: nuclear transport factor 2 family protein [Steroidobacteraceae bacterium]|nr:nuclear transport factor 2 family protein [Steroidobacteraceae bacterium]
MVSGPFFNGVAFARDEARVAALRSAEAARFEAQVDADAKALGQLLDEGLEYTHSNGDLDTKASFIESLVTGTRDYISSTATIETVRIFGDVGVIRGKAKVSVGGKDRQPMDLHIGYTDVWLWKDGRWQMTAWRSVRLPDSPAK